MHEDKVKVSELSKKLAECLKQDNIGAVKIDITFEFAEGREPVGFPETGKQKPFPCHSTVASAVAANRRGCVKDAKWRYTVIAD